MTDTPTNKAMKEQLRDILFSASGGISHMANEEIDKILDIVISAAIAALPEEPHTQDCKDAPGGLLCYCHANAINQSMRQAKANLLELRNEN